MWFLRPTYKKGHSTPFSPFTLQGFEGKYRGVKMENTHEDSAYDQSYHLNKSYGRRKKKDKKHVKLR